MAKCGVCGGFISLTMVPHGVICDDDTKAESIPYGVDDANL